MRIHSHVSVTILVSAALLTGAANAAELKQVGTIVVPGEKLANFDISFVDQATGRYYLADRSNRPSISLTPKPIVTSGASEASSAP